MKIKITVRSILLITVLFILGFIGIGVVFVNFLNTTGRIIAGAILLGAIIRYEWKTKRKKGEQKPAYESIGQLIFSDQADEFSAFYNLYLHDNQQFLVQYAELLKENDDFDLEALEPMDALYLFADAKQLVEIIDWRGEENEYEVETFVEGLIGQTPAWTYTSAYRDSSSKARRRDGRSAIDLFRSVDKDLQAIHRRLLFFELNGDAYTFTVVPSAKFDKITSLSSGDFHGVDQLR